MMTHRYTMHHIRSKTFVRRGAVNIRNNKLRIQFRQCTAADTSHQSHGLTLRLEIETWFARANRSSLTLFLCNKWEFDNHTFKSCTSHIDRYDASYRRLRIDQGNCNTVFEYW